MITVPKQVIDQIGRGYAHTGSTPSALGNLVAPLSWDLKSVRPEALRHRLSTALPFTESANSVLSLRVAVYRGLRVNPHHLSYQPALRMTLKSRPWVFPRVLLHTVRIRIVQELSLGK